MILLRAIGRFFARIGRWIKETAWVQPLLIVGAIFGLIFAIPPITRWVQSWFQAGDEAAKYYRTHEVSLSGAQNEDPNSDANKLFDYMLSKNPSQEDKNKWGEKFYVVFVQENCVGCTDIYKGFKVLDEKWNNADSEFITPEGQEKQNFKFYTIFIDSTATIDNEEKNLFKEYFYNSYDLYFEEIGGDMQECNYANNNIDSNYQNDLKTLEDVSQFASPTCFLFDKKGDIKTELGVSECLFTVKGKGGDTGAYPVARTLYDCWYHQDCFGENYNPTK